MSDAIISCVELRRSFGVVQALNGLSLTVPAGSVYGFLGPNGAGKTTALRILTGLAAPDSGSAMVAGVPVQLRSPELARCIGYLPEEPAFYSWMTAAEYLDHVGRLFGLTANERASRSAELLSAFHLSDSAQRRIGGFSRGMRQRLGLAQALINQPTVLILDEPVSALDPAGRHEVLEAIDGLRGHTTVLMSSHVLADVERVCDVVGIIAQGRLLAEEPTTQLLGRYAAPAYELQLPPEAENALHGLHLSLSALPFVTQVTRDEHTLRVAVTSLAEAQVGLLPAVAALGLPLVRYQQVQPTLEDVFLRLVQEEAA